MVSVYLTWIGISLLFASTVALTIIAVVWFGVEGIRIATRAKRRELLEDLDNADDVDSLY